jgi:predicted MPP superfamily phosphohydrolase
MPRISTFEIVRVFLFVGAIVVVYAMAAWFLVGKVGRRLAPRAFSPHRLPAWVRRAIYCLASAGSICIAYAHYVEPYRVEVTHVTLSSEKLPAGSRPIRIVQISDLHCDPAPRLEESLPDLVAAEHPDAIVFTGDSVNSLAALPLLKRVLSRLAAIAPTFAVKGNWDAWYWRGVDLFADTGVVVLNGAGTTLRVRESSVWIGGVAVESERLLPQLLSAVPAGVFSILLYHAPDLIDDVEGHDVDLYCAGHTHGGQVALPVYGALVTFSKFGKKYEGGLYRMGRAWLYVNRGIGMEGGGAPRVRFWARPEITVFEIGPPASDR